MVFLMSIKIIRKNLIALTIKEIDSGNWNKMTINYMSKKLKISSQKILTVCSSKDQLLDIWSEDINQEMVKDISKEELKEVPTKERILELMLCRFDVLSKKKKEIDILFKLSKSSIKESKNSMLRIYRAMELICNYSDISLKGSQGILKVKVLSIIWIMVFREWQKNKISNEDMLLSKLDRNLTYAENIKNTFC